MNHNSLKKNIAILFAFIIVLASCSDGSSPTTWKDKGVDLTQYTTYAWIAPGDSALNHRRDDKLFAGTIQHFADLELQAKGMKMDTHSPDVVFMFDTALEDRVKYSQTPTLSVGVGYGGPGYYVGGMAPIAGGQITANPYKHGTLMIEMIDFKTGKAVWRSTASKDLDAASDDIATIIQKAVKSMFYYYPKHKH